MPAVTVVTLHVEGSDQTIADGIRTISQTLNQFLVEQRRADPQPETTAELLPAPTQITTSPKALAAQPSAPRTSQRRGKEQGPIMTALRSLLLKPHTRQEIHAELQTSGIPNVTKKKVSAALTNGKARHVFRRGSDGTWLLA